MGYTIKYAVLYLNHQTYLWPIPITTYLFPIDIITEQQIIEYNYCTSLKLKLRIISLIFHVFCLLYVVSDPA